jgi:hypothetical protein
MLVERIPDLEIPVLGKISIVSASAPRIPVEFDLLPALK